MFHRYFRLLPLSLLNLLSLAATGQQAQEGFTMAWWMWLVIISVILLFTFIVLVALDWREAEGQAGGQGTEAESDRNGE